MHTRTQEKSRCHPLKYVQKSLVTPYIYCLIIIANKGKLEAPFLKKSVKNQDK